MTTLDDFDDLGNREQHLAVISTVRADGSPQASLVNAGVLTHPISGERVVGFVTYGKVKLGNIRSRPQTAVTFRSGWNWATVEGPATVIGPEDPHPEVDAERLRLILRDVFVAAGGTHDDWDEYDRTMLVQHRAAVFIRVDRVYSN